jgi:LEA14-like dessication related protein
MSPLRAALSAILIATVLALTGCSSVPRRDPVQVYVVGIEPLQGQGLELRMLVKLRVQNPNNAPIEYDGVYVDMQVQGRRFASGVSDATGSVPRFGEAVLEIPVSVPAFRLVRGAMGVLDAERTGKIAYELNGKLAGPLFNSVRFSSKGEMAVPQGIYDMDGQ